MSKQSVEMLYLFLWINVLKLSKTFAKLLQFSNCFSSSRTSNCETMKAEKLINLAHIYSSLFFLLLFLPFSSTSPASPHSVPSRFTRLSGDLPDVFDRGCTTEKRHNVPSRKKGHSTDLLHSLNLNHNMPTEYHWLT